MIQLGFKWFLAGFLLLIWGFVYNLAVARIERKGYLEGFRWLGAAIGSAFILFGVAIIDLRSAALAGCAFFIFGLPVALGEIWRYVKAREREQEYVRQTETLAE